jgi:hypothetical protein
MHSAFNKLQRLLHFLRKFPVITDEVAPPSEPFDLKGRIFLQKEVFPGNLPFKKLYEAHAQALPGSPQCQPQRCRTLPFPVPGIDLNQSPCSVIAHALSP